MGGWGGGGGGGVSRHALAVPAVTAASDQSLLWNKTKDFYSI